MEEHGITVPDEYVRPALYRDLTKAYELTEELLKLKDPPTCILYPDDVACFGGINAIRANGLAIPGDISVVGYDGVKAAQYEEPRADHLWSEHRSDGKRGGTSADRGNRAPHDDGTGDPYRVRTSDGRADRKAVASVRLTGFVIAGFLHDR